MSTYKKYICFTLLFMFLFSADILYSQNFGWNTIGQGNENGTNGAINAINVYGSNMVFAGAFTRAGSINVNNIAIWNGSSWSQLAGGLNDTVRALTVFSGRLIAGGKFTNAGNHIAAWDGSSWTSLGGGVNDQVYALAVYNGNLIAAGKFTAAGGYNAYHIAKWDGNSWSALGSGTDDDIYALSPFGIDMVAGGKFINAGGISANRIAKWDGNSWSALGQGMNDRVFAIASYGGLLVAGGAFTYAGSDSAGYVAAWNGTMWFGLGVSMDDWVYSLVYHEGSLIMGGSFKNAGSLYVSRVCKWDGGGYNRMITGTNNRVNVLFANDTDIYAGGDFTVAGGDYEFYTAVWTNQIVHSVSGTVRYADDNQIVTTGVVKAVRMDVSTREVIVIDSALIQSNGTYQIHHGRNDSTFIVAFPNDELADNFVPTYHPSSIDWITAEKVIPSINLSSIDIYVYRVTPQPLLPPAANIGGHVYLNYTPQQFLTGYPFSKDGIVYAKQNGIYRKFAVSDSTESYSLSGLVPGTYDLFANRIGYTSASKTVTLGSSNLDTINFYLDTAGLIGIHPIGSPVPDKFVLYQNYPNPFNPTTKIRFALDKNSHVRLMIYDILGREISLLVDGNLFKGEYEMDFNASALPSGIYFYKLSTEYSSVTKKMVVLK
jgi:hypothetical protein